MAYFFNRGFNYYDEGHILHLAQRILQGDIPYRDFHFIYTPGTLYITVLAFKIGGVSILSGRIVLLLTAITTAVVLYAVVKKYTAQWIPSVLAVLMYLAWAPTHINFPWPVNFVILTSLVYILSMMIYRETGKIAFLLLAGSMIFATFFFKHNFGLGLLVVNGLYIATNSKRRIVSIATAAGLAVPTLIYLLYLHLTNSLIPFISDMYYYTYLKIIHEGMLKTPFIYGSGTAAFIKTAFFLSPALITIVTGYILFSRRILRLPQIYLISFPLLFYVLGIRPTTDFIHVCPLLAISGLPLALLFLVKNKYVALLAACTAVVLITGGIYTALFRGYYRWETPLIRQTTFIDNPTVKIYVDHKYADIIGKLDSYFAQAKQKQFSMLVYEYAPMFYVVTGATNPTKYDLLPSSALSPYVEYEVLRQLSEHDTDFVLTDAPLSSRVATNITKYIQAHYVKDVSMYEFDIWVNKNKNKAVLVDKNL